MKADTKPKTAEWQGHVTLFPNQYASRMKYGSMTLSDLRDLVLRTTASDKIKLPFVKFAKFGHVHNENNCLRYDENVHSIDGCELDYDEGKISFEEAIKIAKAARIKSLLYTTTSYTKEVPAWRILCPASCELPPSWRLKLVKRVNGLYGGNFCGASFTLSQSFYFGGVKGEPKPRAVIVDGDFIDLRNDLDAGAMGKRRDGHNGSVAPHGIEAHLALLGDGPGLRGFRDPLRSAIASWAATHGVDGDRDALKAKLREAIAKAPTDKPRKYLADDKNIDKMIEFAVKKYGHGDEDIRRLNEVHAVLPIGGKTRVVTFGELEDFPGRKTIVMTQSLDDFVSLQNKYRHKYIDAKGVEQSIPMGVYWRSSQHRRQYDGGMAFMPRHAEPVVGNKLNLWGGYGVQPIKGDCQLFLDFMLEVICSGNQAHFDYLVKREAFILQKRQRCEIALGLHSKEEGVGKGFYERHIGHLYGNHAMQITNPAHIVGKFNPHLETLLRLTADEALFVGDPRHRNALFSLVTEPTIAIEPKHCGVYQAYNFLNISITTNAEHFIPVSGTARRFFVPTVSACHMQNFKYFAAIVEQLNSGGYEALLFHFLHIDLSGFNVRDVPKTAGLLEQAAYSRRGVEGLVEEACNTGRVPAPHDIWPGFTVTGQTQNYHGNYSGFSYELSRATDPELRRMSPLMVSRRLCKDWGCASERRREQGMSEVLTKHVPQTDTDNKDRDKNKKDRKQKAENLLAYAKSIKDQDKDQDQDQDRDQGKRTYVLKWPPLAELRERFVKRFGPQDWQHSEVTEWQTS